MLLKGFTPTFCFSLAEAISGIKGKNVAIFAEKPGAYLFAGVFRVLLFWLRRCNNIRWF